MSWLYAQTWLWYLIAFAVGVLLAWLLLVRPQQRRLRTLRGLAGAGVDHDLYAESRNRLAGAALFDSASGGSGASTAEPTTEQIPVVDSAEGTQTTEIPVQPPADDSVTGEIPAVPGAAASEESASVGRDSASDSGPASAESAPSDVEATVPDSGDPASTSSAASSGDEPESTESPSSVDSASANPDPDPAEGGGQDASPADSTTGDSTTGDSITDDASAPEAGPTESGTTDSGSSEPVAGPTETESAPATNGAAADRAGPDAVGAANGSAAAPQGLLAVPASAVTAGPYHRSVRPGPDGAAPSEEFTIKGNEDSMLFHTPDSPYYGRTKAEVWFSRVEDAEAAGFTNWKRRK